ncbi:hypothetical protein ACPF64_13815 [Acinetobacter sp. KB005]|nr:MULTISPECIES: hypothetical protein [Acinetobacter]
MKISEIKMFRIFIILCTALVSVNVYAEKKMTKNDAIDVICGGIGEYAKSVMTSRQLGENIANNIAVLNKQKNMEEPIKSYHREIIYEAYREPKWSTKENQDNAITEFSNKMYMTCADAFQKELAGLE